MRNTKTPFSENNRQHQPKAKVSSLSSHIKQLPAQLPASAAARAQCVHWLYRAQANLHFSRSTLFLAFSLLDQLLLRSLALSQDTCELVAGALLLLCTKFNEVYPVTVRKLNLLAEDEFSLQQYAEAEAAMLMALDFTLQLDATYEQLCALEAQFEGRAAEQAQELVKLAVLNPNETFRYGPSSLVLALQQAASQGGLLERSSNCSTQGR
jgi:hypothetical protein